MDTQLLQHLTTQRDTLRFDSRHCGYDMQQAELLRNEYLHFENRIHELWKDYEGSGVVPPRYRGGREAAGERRQAV